MTEKHKQLLTASADRRTLAILTVIVIVAAAAVTLTFLPVTLFNTKGEPREAIVALSMLRQDNWILPVSFGTDIPYKPPMLAWLISVFSLIFNGGEVSEWTSRMPSALALIVMVTALFRFMAHRTRLSVALLAAVLTLTAFEVYRAGMTCRVDMLNTMFTVLAILALYRLAERGWRGIPWTAMLMMSGAFLTKGPVGVFIPCMVMWVVAVVEAPGAWWRVTWRLTLYATGASVLPLLWYVAAWHQGGQGFLDLVMEENFGRLTGSMSYDSHVNPAWYNVVTLLSGWLPYTLLLVLSLFSLHYSRPHRTPLRQLWARFRAMDPLYRLALIATVMIFVFYCIPKSKRSVYLLPVYPFIALYIARYIKYMCKAGPGMIRLFSVIIGSLAILAPVAYIYITLSDFTTSSDSTSMLLGDMRAYEPAWWQVATLGMSLLAGLMTLAAVIRGTARNAFINAVGTILVIYASFSALYSPSVLNARSDRNIAMTIDAIVPEGRIYAWGADRLLRPYTIGFYTGDRVCRIDLTEAGTPCLLIVSERDREAFDAWNAARRVPYSLRPVMRTSRRSCDLRSPLLIFEADVPAQPQ